MFGKARKDGKQKQPSKRKEYAIQFGGSGTHLDWSVRNVCMCGLLGKNGWHRVEEP